MKAADPDRTTMQGGGISSLGYGSDSTLLGWTTELRSRHTGQDNTDPETQEQGWAYDAYQEFLDANKPEGWQGDGD